MGYGNFLDAFSFLPSGVCLVQTAISTVTVLYSYYIFLILFAQLMPRMRRDTMFPKVGWSRLPVSQWSSRSLDLACQLGIMDGVHHLAGDSVGLVDQRRDEAYYCSTVVD